MDPLSYLLGVLTLPLLAAVLLVLLLVFVPGARSVTCELCGFETKNKPPLVHWMLWLWHDQVRSRRRTHRDKLRAWRIKVGLDTPGANVESS